MKYNKRTDKNQAEIVDALRKVGVQVIITNFGQDFPDLLCGYLGEWRLVEVKQPNGSLDRGQLEFIANARGVVQVITTIDEAMDMFARGDFNALVTQHRVHQWLLANPNQKSLSVKKYRNL